MQSRLKGIVKWFNAEKGYGYISAEDGKEYFVHFSSILDTGFKKLEENWEVEFTLGVDHQKRVQAKEVLVTKRIAKGA
jgi:CspA family cold shock protein